jgi:hypothetical protein
MQKKSDRFADVAAKLAGGPAPQWLVQGLEHFSRFVGAPETKPDVEIEQQMLEAAKLLAEWLPMYGYLEEFGFECPDEVEDVLTLLPKVIELLEEDAEAPDRKGDKRRLICAAVVSETFQMLHQRDRTQPFSPAVKEACEKYWQACGNQPTGRVDDPENWEGQPRNWVRLLKQCRAAGGDSWVRSILEGLRSGTGIQPI